MKIVGLMSTYREGRLAAGAVRSLQAVGLDDLIIFEGPAGDPIAGCDGPEHDTDFAGVAAHTGRWRTDGRKRDAMLQETKRRHPEPGPLWGVIIDGDEILRGGEYLRDVLQSLVWNDEAKGAHPNDADNAPWARWPLRLIEQDGSVSLITARCVRLDLIRRWEISSSVITNIHGVTQGWGNQPEESSVWLELWLKAVDRGKMIAWPPLPCEPCIVHRSHLRHPARRGVRMSEQETRELAAAQRDKRFEQ